MGNRAPDAAFTGRPVFVVDGTEVIGGIVRTCSDLFATPIYAQDPA